jgi:2-polyprenyl-3-methyl-5-hydroxy-6-metoxy-1,4-benzoquinol methylase
MRILDVGCNTGRGGVVLRQAKPSAHVEGLEMLAARAALVPAGVYDAVTVGDLTTVASTGAKFDALVMGELIEHVPYSALEAFISCAARVLSPGGRILLTTPNPHYLFLRWRGGSVMGGAHVSVHCPATLTEFLNHRGFRVVRVEGTGRVSRVVGVRVHHRITRE